jgi:hypothetical protein
MELTMIAAAKREWWELRIIDESVTAGTKTVEFLMVEQPRVITVSGIIQGEKNEESNG